MSIKRTRRASSPTGLILVLLALVALLGLLTGFLTHVLVSHDEGTASVGATSTAVSHATAGRTNTPASTHGVTQTATTSTVSGQFQLSITVSPKSMTPGQQISITVHAFTPDTHAPIAGLPCVLRAPTNGTPALFSTWPPAQSTDSTGVASWTLTAPNQPAGAYAVEAYASAAKWSYRLDSTVEVKAS